MPHIINRWLRKRGLWHQLERLAWIVGLVASIAWAAGSLADRSAARAEIERFTAVYAQAPRAMTVDAPDFQLWSPARIQAWRAAQAAALPPPLGVLRIARLHVEAAILEGIDGPTLNRAVGHIPGTAAPGDAGNTGIAGHRDSFFRGLKNIAIGDLIELATPHGDVAYRVERTWIVTPDDVWVLDPTASAAVTLVTCYPFHFVGSAPQRFIVRAVPEGARSGARDQ